jgi:hypothetical protein
MSQIVEFLFRKELSVFWGFGCRRGDYEGYESLRCHVKYFDRNSQKLHTGRFNSEDRYSFINLLSVVIQKFKLFLELCNLGNICVFWIWGYQIYVCEAYNILGCDVVYSDRSLPKPQGITTQKFVPFRQEMRLLSLYKH